jgi:hypothetical protein
MLIQGIFGRPTSVVYEASLKEAHTNLQVLGGYLKLNRDVAWWAEISVVNSDGVQATTNVALSEAQYDRMRTQMGDGLVYFMPGQAEFFDGVIQLNL